MVSEFRDAVCGVAVSLGFLPADVAAVDDDNAVVQFLASVAVELEAFKDAIRQYRIIITEGAIGEPTPAFPANPAFALPEIRPTGIWQRLIELVERIRSAPAYTPEIGALLGIIPSTPQPQPEGDLKPAITVSESIGGYKFNLDITRKGMPAFKVQFARANDADTWHDVAFATNNPVAVTIPPLTPGQPERILVRGILLDHNEPVGLPSDVVFVTVNP